MSDQQQILNKVITIKSVEQTKTKDGGNTQFKLKDHEDVRFLFFKLKKDGTMSQVATQWKEMSLDEGSTVQIGYVIDNYTDKDGNARTSNKIINFRETQDQPTVSEGGSRSSAPVGRQPGRPDFDPQRASIERQVAFKAAIEVFLSMKEFYKPSDIKTLTDEFSNIIADKQPQLPPKQAASAQSSQEVPTIQIEDEIGDGAPWPEET